MSDEVMKIIPLILCGGSGTRLWPVSRPSKPKQFLHFGSQHSLFQETTLRCRSELFDLRPIVVGAEKVRFLIAEDLLEIGVEADIMLEPVARNSCAAIAAGCLQALERDSRAMVLVLAADHHIPDADAFVEAAALGAEDAARGDLVTFGIRPTRPATGYGYIAPGERRINASRVSRFREKPDPATAERYIADGCLWNSGNFLFRAETFLKELEEMQPDIFDCVARAFDGRLPDLDFIRLNEAAFAETPSISVDYAVMEHTGRASVLPVDYQWSDIGSWDAVADTIKADENGNSVVGEASLLNASNNFVHSQARLTTLVGVDNMVVVSTPDCVLVADRAGAENVKQLVEQLKEEGHDAAEMALQIFRPWGNYEQLDVGGRFQVKRLTVKPGAELSLQKHRHRAEHWVIVEGEAEVTIGNEIRIMGADQSTYVPLGEVHRLANRSDEPVVIIEVQTGSYFGEDDIIRLEDSYNRDGNPAGVMD